MKEIICLISSTLAFMFGLMLLVTFVELDDAHTIYCSQKYQNNVINYKKCLNTQFTKVLQENKDE